ncbi:hypothetical protein AB6A40_006616 [Gnathostoma spinigerum]|uniref:Glycoside hydrolase family 19 catalytic domain-containing protein n=1 Tax=Gnathostoma spinigerum TaxID=75299 RepID=A0ABD6ET95_9BILA
MRLIHQCIVFGSLVLLKLSVNGEEWTEIENRKDLGENSSNTREERAVSCPNVKPFGNGPPTSCSSLPSDPNNLPKSKLEEWFTRAMFEDLFPRANLGWGPNKCWPYSYDAFVIAARYFPTFGTTSPNNGWTQQENYRRDVAAFFAHAVQETGENNADFYQKLPKNQADECFYRGGFFNWFEGGPISSFLNPSSPGLKPEDGAKCIASGRYCESSPEIDYWFKCGGSSTPINGYYNACYFGRGAIQISYNYNYGQFQTFLLSKKITVDILNNPNLVITKMDPPLAILASLWFYMTPQPPKPAMHDIVLGQWNPGPKNDAAGYKGAIFGPTSLVINNECNGEDPTDPGGPGESRRIKAFKWFAKVYFKIRIEDDKYLTCKNMPQKFDMMQYPQSWQPNWLTTWKAQPCDCAPASYGGMLPYFDPSYYPPEYVNMNEVNKAKCIDSIYKNPSMYGMTPKRDQCLTVPRDIESE